MNLAAAARLQPETQGPTRREERARPSVGALEVEEPPRFTLPETEPGGEASELTALVHRAVELLDRGQVDEAHELLRPRLARDGGLGPVAARIVLLLEGAASSCASGTTTRRWGMRDARSASPRRTGIRALPRRPWAAWASRTCARATLRRRP